MRTRLTGVLPYTLAFGVGFLLVLTAGLHAQDSTPVADAPTSPVGALAYAILLPVVAWISAKIYDGLKTVIPPFDRMPALVHQIAAPVFGFLFGWLTTATGAALLSDVHAIDQTWVAGILNVLLMAGLKRWEKSRHPADATVVLETSRASNGVQG